jgi:hypothetical protein
LLERSFLDLHIVIILELPVIVFVNSLFSGLLNPDRVPGSPEIVECKTKDQCSQQKNNDLRKPDG